MAPESRRRLAVAVTANDDRARYLTDALGEFADLLAEVPFDHIDPFTRYTAAALSFRPRRAEWWISYQMHPLVQRRRRVVLQRGLRRLGPSLDGLIMWGSWFHPGLADSNRRAVFVNYIDQSLALDPVLGEPGGGYIDRRRGHRLQARTYADSAAVLCMSRWAREQTLLAHPGLDSDKVLVVGWGPCAIDLSDETPKWDERRQLILHVSNDFRRKGLDFLVDTAALVRRHVPEAAFVVVGEDYGRMSNVPKAEGVTFTGRIRDRAMLADYFRQASLFFLPHRFDRSPHVLVEAMSASLPIVTSAQGGPLELADGTGAGISVPIGDVQGYANAIVRLLQDRTAAAQMGECGRQLMRQSYTWSAVARKILDAVAAAIATRA